MNISKGLTLGIPLIAVLGFLYFSRNSSSTEAPSAERQMGEFSRAEVMAPVSSENYATLEQPDLKTRPNEPAQRQEARPAVKTSVAAPQPTNERRPLTREEKVPPAENPVSKELDIPKSEGPTEPDPVVEDSPADTYFPSETADLPNEPPVQAVVVPPPPRRQQSEPVQVNHPTRFEPEQQAEPSTLRLDPGTVFEVRLNEEVSTEDSATGEQFEAILDRNIEVGTEIAVPKGSILRGRLLEVVEPGKVKGRASLTMVLDQMRIGENEYSLSTNSITMEAEASKGKDAKTVGAASAVGAVLGAIFGGKKGAAIGGAAGAGAGSAGVLLSKGSHVRLEKERLFSFRLEEVVVVSRR